MYTYVSDRIVDVKLLECILTKYFDVNTHMQLCLVFFYDPQGHPIIAFHRVDIIMCIIMFVSLT